MTETNTRVAFQGEYGAYSEMAAHSYFGEVEIHDLVFEDIYVPFGQDPVDLLLQPFLGTYDVRTILTNQVHLHLASDFPGWLETGTRELQVVSHELDASIFCHFVFHAWSIESVMSEILSR